MTNPEKRVYLLSGEKTAEEWNDVIQDLGHVGLALELTEVVDQEPPIAVPDSLQDFSSYNQFIAPKHALEFWPIYRDVPELHFTKNLANYRQCSTSIYSLVEAPPKGIWPTNFKGEEQQAYLKGNGLTVKHFIRSDEDEIPRLVEQALPGSFPVVQADGFIKLMTSLKDLPRHQQPRIEHQQLSYLRSLAYYLNNKIGQK